VWPESRAAVGVAASGQARAHAGDLGDVEPEAAGDVVVAQLRLDEAKDGSLAFASAAVDEPTLVPLGRVVVRHGRSPCSGAVGILGVLEV